MCGCLSKDGQDGGVRLFVALDLPEGIRSSVWEVGSEFEPHAPALKLVHSDLLHITLRFMGSCPKNRVGAVERAMCQAAERTAPFTLALSGPGSFPNGRAPRVLWMGIEDDAGCSALRDLAAGLDEALLHEDFRLTPSRFSPHITFGRTRDRISAEQRTAVAQTLRRVQALSREPSSFSVHEIALVRSQLQASGPHYSCLRRVPLGSREA